MFFINIYNVYYPTRALKGHRWRSCAVQGFGTTVAPAQYLLQIIGGTPPSRSVTRWSGLGSFCLKPNGGTTAPFDRVAGRKCDVNALRAPQVATSTHFGHPSRSGNAMSTYIGHSGMRPQRISDTPAGLAERRIDAPGILRPSFGHFLINNSLRKEENWCSVRPGALIRSFPY